MSYVGGYTYASNLARKKAESMTGDSVITLLDVARAFALNDVRSFEVVVDGYKDLEFYDGVREFLKDFGSKLKLVEKGIGTRQVFSLDLDAEDEYRGGR